MGGRRRCSSGRENDFGPSNDATGAAVGGATGDRGRLESRPQRRPAHLASGCAIRPRQRSPYLYRLEHLLRRRRRWARNRPSTSEANCLLR